MPPPVSRLPHDVLAEIFSHATSDVPSSTPTQLVLGSVCALWRDVLHNNPRLWTKLYITGMIRDYPAVLQEFFSHIGALGLDVIIPRSTPRQGTTLIPWTPRSFSAANRVLSIIFEDHHDQIRSFRASSLVHQSWPCIVGHITQPNRSFAMLESAEFHFPGFGASFDPIFPGSTMDLIDPSLPIFFANAPRLRTFNISTFKHYRNIPINVPWHQITRLDLRGTGPEYAIALLSTCPSVIDFTFAFQDYPRPPWNLGQMIHIPQVQRFCWRLGTRDPTYQDSHTALFTSVDLPNVRVLQWGSWLPNDEECDWRPFFRRMQNVEKLVCEYPGIHQVNRIWPLFRNLRELHLYENDWADNSPVHRLYELTAKTGQQSLFPELRSLHIEVKKASPFIIACLARLVHSRRKSIVHWIDPNNEAEAVILPPYIAWSSHWRFHSRLEEFSVRVTEQTEPVDFGAFEELIGGSRTHRQSTKELQLLW